MYSRIITIGLLFSIFGFSANSPHDEAIVIHISHGGSVYGDVSMTLTPEGLALRNSHFLQSGERWTRFVDRTDLDTEDLVQVRAFIKRRLCFEDFNNVYVMPTHVSQTPRRFIIGCSSGKSVSILDKDYRSYLREEENERIALDSLVILMNQLVPDEYKSECQIYDYSFERVAVD